MGVVHDADVTEGERERLVIEMIQIEGGGERLEGIAELDC